VKLEASGGWVALEGAGEVGAGGDPVLGATYSVKTPLLCAAQPGGTAEYNHWGNHTSHFVFWAGV
jgi:hypothetical protein